MTTSPDIRGFYAALGIELPTGRKLNGSRPDALPSPLLTTTGDRSPSCSVNLASGAWNCHGCGAHGGAYDAALAVGHTPRSAIDLMIAHGLTAPAWVRTVSRPHNRLRSAHTAACTARPWAGTRRGPSSPASGPSKTR